MRGRAVFAAVAIGAITAATAGPALIPALEHSPTPQADPASGTSAGMAAVNTNATAEESVEVQPVVRALDASAEAQQLAESEQITGRQSADQGAAGFAGVTFAPPAKGTVVSTFGGQYGTFHYGIEIKNAPGTPIVAAADGVIIAAGPTSGFGLWVKEQLSDGTVLVYARMDTYSVIVGEHVHAGEQIAKMGDRGFGDGYTLHFEVWDPTGKKIDPETWLNTRGVFVGN